MSVEERIRAAARAAADTVDEVRELELPADPAWGGGRRMPSAGRWWTWAAPLAAAAAVIALAVSLVIVRDVPRTSPARPVPSADAVPRYYVELDPHGHGQTARNGLLVGDTLTGKTVATVAPPAGYSFWTISAAADDRTFAVFATPAGAAPTGSAPATGSVFLLRLAPGTASPATLTRVGGNPLADVQLSDVVSMALSPSGREFAVAETTGTTKTPWLGIYSAATGRLVHAWSVPGTPSFSFDPLGGALTWVDGDQAIVFPAVAKTTAVHNPALRRLDIATGGSNLSTDSREIWSAPAPAPASGILYCSLGPTVSADGKTVVCQQVTFEGTATTTSSTIRWLGYPVGGRSAVRVLYQVSATTPAKDDGRNVTTLWVSPSAATMLVQWSLIGPTGTLWPTLHFGVVSNGIFTPLKVPQIRQDLMSDRPFIAW